MNTNLPTCQPCSADDCGACPNPDRAGRPTADGEIRPTCCCGRRFVDPPATYRERMAWLVRRLRAALDPQTEQELVIVEWLGNWDIPTLEPLADMIERAKRGAS